MVATQTKFRRGTNTQVNAFVPAEGEIIVDLTNDRLCVGDATRAGGFPIPNFLDIQSQAFTKATTGGTADAITLTLAVPIIGYTSDLKIGFIPTLTNTGPVQVNVDGKGLKDLQKYDGSGLGDLEPGDLVPGVYYEIYYDGVQFQMASSGSGITAVSQGDLNTLEGSVSSSSLGAIVVLPGGEYGFYPNIRVTRGTATAPFRAEAHIFSTSNNPISGYAKACWITIGFAASPGTGTMTAFQRYITSSPPYDLGDGDVAGFVFALVNKDGDIISSYAADTPPWAYNGPTDIRCSHKCKVSGKKFRRVLKKRTFEQVMDGAPVEYKLEEITQDLKNQDMGLIPHPFGYVPEGHTVVLIDPMDDKIKRMMDYQNSGGDLQEELYSGKIAIDNSKLKRKGPKGVPIHKMKFKSSRAK